MITLRCRRTRRCARSPMPPAASSSRPPTRRASTRFPRAPRIEPRAEAGLARARLRARRARRAARARRRWPLARLERPPPVTCDAARMRPSLFEFAGGEPAFLRSRRRTTRAASPTPSSTTRSRIPASTRSTSSGWRRTGPRSWAARRVLGAVQRPVARPADARRQRRHERPRRRFVDCFTRRWTTPACRPTPRSGAALRRVHALGRGRRAALLTRGVRRPAGAAMPHWSWDGLQAPG